MPERFPLSPSAAAVLAALAAAFPLTGQAAAAGRVDFALGDVKAVAPDGRSRPLAKGAEIASGETIDTGSGRAQVRFTDGAQVSLAPQTQFRVDEYQFAGKADGSEKGFFSLLKGAMRTITGAVGRTNRDNYKVNTAVATIGIRGTEYSVAYGNSISVTTGEGVIEVCNAAGCLIVNSGETAFVPDANTRPVMTDKKTEVPPPPVQQEQLPGFVAGNQTSSDGTPAGLTTGLPTGPGYSIVGAGHYLDSYYSTWYADQGFYDGNTENTHATFEANGLALFTAYDGAEGLARGTPVGMLSADGVIGWGRWIDGSGDIGSGPESWQHLHYVVGVPTPLSDMSALYSANVTATYTQIGFTYPTAWDGSTWHIGTSAPTATLTADFGNSSVSGSLTVPFLANTYTSSWSGYIISSAHFDGYGTALSTGTDCGGSSCYSYINGFFAGANASHAGLVYSIYDTQYGGGMGGPGAIQGAVVFKR